MKVKTIRISAKCSDLCSVLALDADGNTLAEGDGYVPDFMPGQHWGDYVMLDINPETGTITNWVRPSDSAIIRNIKEM